MPASSEWGRVWLVTVCRTEDSTVSSRCGSVGLSGNAGGVEDVAAAAAAAAAAAGAAGSAAGAGSGTTGTETGTTGSEAGGVAGVAAVVSVVVSGVAGGAVAAGGALQGCFSYLCLVLAGPGAAAGCCGGSVGPRPTTQDTMDPVSKRSCWSIHVKAPLTSQNSTQLAAPAAAPSTNATATYW